jgi:hypothetical protein
LFLAEKMAVRAADPSWSRPARSQRSELETIELIQAMDSDVDVQCGDIAERGTVQLLRHDRAYSGYAPIMGTTWLTALPNDLTGGTVRGLAELLCG